MKDTNRKRRKISLFGNFGAGNLGNESTLQAILYNLQQHLPDADVTCICTVPEAVSATHNIAAFPMRGKFDKQERCFNNPVARLLKHIFIRIPRELYQWLEAFRTLGGTAMLIVPGTQFLSDNLAGPFGWPYSAFRWSVIAKIRRCKLLFISVGVGPLRHPLSRFFVRSALRLANYRSYRDDLSRQYMRNIGFNSTDDPVYPDLAFSLPLSKIPGDSQINRKKSVVSVGVKDYQGQYGPQPLKHLDDADKIYRRFIEEVADFVIWLLEHTYTVRLIIGDVIYDAQAREDIRKSINRRNIQYKNNQLIDEPIESNKQLISQMVTSDIVVSPRFHNVLLGLLLNKPVIALSYHEKFLTLMGCPGLAEYNLHIDHFNANTLIEKFIKLESNSDELKQQISRMTAENRRLLDEQYNVITNIYHD